MGNRDKRGREAKKPKKTAPKPLPGRPRFEPPPAKPATPNPPPAPVTVPQT
jgi:hypothetical protein